MKINRNVPHCFCNFLLMTVICFILCLSQVSLLNYIRVHDVTLHKMQYWQLFCGTGKSDYRPLAGKANQQMTDTNVFNRVSQRWFSLVCVAGDVSLKYFLDWDVRCLLVEALQPATNGFMYANVAQYVSLLPFYMHQRGGISISLSFVIIN